MHDPSCPHGQSFGACLAPPLDSATVVAADINPPQIPRTYWWPNHASASPLRVDFAHPDPVAAGDPWPFHLRLPAVAPVGPILRPDSRATPACPPCSGACGQGRDCPSGPRRNPASLWAAIPAAAPWLILAAVAVAAVLNQFFL